MLAVGLSACHFFGHSFGLLFNAMAERAAVCCSNTIYLLLEGCFFVVVYFFKYIDKKLKHYNLKLLAALEMM